MFNQIPFIQKDKLKQVLITRTATKTIVSESVVEKVIFFAYAQANKAAKVNNEVEISGFGKFIFSEKKALKRLAKLREILDAYQNQLERAIALGNSDEMRRITKKVNSCMAEVISIKTRLNEPETSVPGLEEPPVSDEGTQGDDLQNELGKAPDLPQL
jgi:nucleoid DNA-binding protein